jgi:enoyl-[acyl-carrier-protein] reductase (NADH)
LDGRQRLVRGIGKEEGMEQGVARATKKNEAKQNK